uniref:Uncharacterized protein n=1 Tax=Caenorhabditis japonica TaxID=281687 RepID=A0A8R1IPF3_CAEJA
MPQVVFDAYRSQIKTANLLFLASRYWEDSKNLAKIVDGGFIKHVETVCGKSIGMDIPFELLAQFVLTAVGSLKAEYEAEKKQPVRPELAKMKPALDIAIRTGMFHTMMTDRQQRPSHTHTTSTRTPVANATNSK